MQEENFNIFFVDVNEKLKEVSESVNKILTKDGVLEDFKVEE